MKTLRKVCAVVALGCLFSVAANAGEIHTGYTPPPPPLPPPGAAEEATEATGDVLTDLIADLLGGVLSVF